MQERSEEDTTNTNFNFNIKFSSQIPGQKKKKAEYNFLPCDKADFIFFS